MKVEGVFVPLSTPLNVDEASLERVIEPILDGGANGIFVLGSSGEFPNLSLATRECMILATKEIIAGRVPLLAVLYAGTRGGVFKSVDGGVGWSEANTGLTETNVGALAIDSLQSVVQLLAHLVTALVDNNR